MKYIITENKMVQVVVKYLNKVYGDLEEYITDKHPDSVFFVKDKKVFMELELDNREIFVDYATIWKDLVDTFSLENDEIRHIIRKWVEETYNIRDVAVFGRIRENPLLVEETYKLKYVITESKLEQVAIKYLNKMYGDLEEYRTDKHPDRIFFIKGKKVYMEQGLKNGYLLVDYDTIWKDLENMFSLEYDEIQSFIRKWVEEDYELSGVIPQRFPHAVLPRWNSIIK